jgi:hypothetical protein
MLSTIKISMLINTQLINHINQARATRYNLEPKTKSVNEDFIILI